MKTEILAELEKIRVEHDGILRPADVVETAANPGNVLHGHFLWDDKAAGHQYRLWQARQLIRVCVIPIEGSREPIRAYLCPEATADKGGYYSTPDVMGDDERRALMLKQAERDMRVFRAKYNQLSELAEVFAAMKNFDVSRKEGAE